MAFFFGGSGIRNAGLEGASDKTLSCAGCSETGRPSLTAVLSESMLTMYSPPRLCLLLSRRSTQLVAWGRASLHGHFRHQTTQCMFTCRTVNCGLARQTLLPKQLQSCPTCCPRLAQKRLPQVLRPQFPQIAGKGHLRRCERISKF